MQIDNETFYEPKIQRVEQQLKALKNGNYDRWVSDYWTQIHRDLLRLQQDSIKNNGVKRLPIPEKRIESVFDES